MSTARAVHIGQNPTLGALRSWVRRMRARALEDGDLVLAKATWFFSYRPKDDPDGSARTIEEHEFFAQPDDQLGHPRPGIYSAGARAESGEVLEEKTGEWLADYEKPEEPQDGAQSLAS